MSNPCIKCLVMPACKGRLSQLYIDRHNAYSVIVRMCRTCDMLSDYVRPFQSYEYDLDHRQEAVFFLTGIDLSYQGGMTYTWERPAPNA